VRAGEGTSTAGVFGTWVHYGRRLAVEGSTTFGWVNLSRRK
jgi:hypothetical protein